MQVICYDCYGTGEIGITKDNRVIACETCGGHEDELGTGRVDVVCAACADKDAEIARLSAELVATMVESHKLTECLDKRATALRAENTKLRAALRAVEETELRIVEIAQERIAELQADNARLGAELDERNAELSILRPAYRALFADNALMRAEVGQRFDANNEEMVRRETSSRMLKEALRRTQQERDTMRTALKAAPEPRGIIGSAGQLRYCEWYHLQCQAALKEGE